MNQSLQEAALNYHEYPFPGKIATQLTKPAETQKDLALAYSPGVAEPCRKIAADPDSVYRYTQKSNLVGVISNGTAVLGLGAIGALASKPVMEGKVFLFNKFSDLSGFDLEIDERDPKKFIEIVAALEPTFGGINLEDIRAPECFEIEEALKKRMSIPVFHDDQHGTAITLVAALENAITLQGKSLTEIKIVCIGAGAAGIASLQLLERRGVSKSHIFLFDTKGLITSDRGDLNIYKQAYAQTAPHQTLEEAMCGADVFIGLSVANLLSPEMVKSMAFNPVIFAMANPDPEICPMLAHSARSDLIMATGRSDFPNQVNNVLCFPYIFRGALDVRASSINEEMKDAAIDAIKTLVHEPIPQSVLHSYGLENLSFGPQYILPKPNDPRLKRRVSGAVARAAVKSQVAQKPLPIIYELAPDFAAVD
jgi:malate dehydrogenase (oxaloacetate-decarboxylating)(NADP+)